MGTRAIITKDNKPFLATHWDGYPDGLGQDLLSCCTDEEIITVAKECTIDAADKKVSIILNKERFAHIADRANTINRNNNINKQYTVEELEELYKNGQELTFNIMSPNDYPIAEIDDYRDFAEYQYDLSNGKWRYRHLIGQYPESLKKAKRFYPI